MSKRATSPIGLLPLCLLVILLASCAAEPTDDSVAALSTPGATPTCTPVSPPTPTTPSEPALTPTQPPPTEPVFASHTVRRGDTLLGLATQYDVPMAAIQLHNQMADSTVLHVGQTLSIPLQVSWEGASPFWIVHVVKEGETLTSIGQAYGLAAERIQSVNGLTDADLLGIGQELILPLAAPVVPRAPTHTPTPPPTATPAPSLTAESPTASPTAVSVAPPPADVAAWPYETVRIINEVRAAHGLGPLAYNETLARAAQAHANDCAQRGWCSHTGSDGSDIKTRIIRAGYDPASWAECWAQSQSPQHAVDMWMDEVPPNDPHRRTLLTTWLSEIGMGVAQTSWGYYFIADFGRP
ncbi:MAG TPA: LysM peptidoglycan-binding domain-containing protein [Anaerolineae bacterium]|nr:LysM peptidoglycan-binding domain-containing protein [Anaerolineae bacterium]